MDMFLYFFAQATTVIYRIILYCIVAFVCSVLISGDNSEIFWSMLGLLIFATVVIWIIDTAVQLISYLVNKKKSESEMSRSLRHDIFVRMDYSQDPDEWIEENLKILQNDMLDDFFDETKIKKKDFDQQFLTPYGKLVYISALRNGYKTTNFLTWILHTRAMRRALKKHEFQVGGD